MDDGGGRWAMTSHDDGCCYADLDGHIVAII